MAPLPQRYRSSHSQYMQMTESLTNATLPLSSDEPSTVSDKPTIHPSVAPAPATANAPAQSIFVFGSSSAETETVYQDPPPDANTQVVQDKSLLQYSQDSSAGAGILKAARTTRVLPDEEMKGKYAESNSEFMAESDVKELPVSELRIRGFGRAPSGFCYSSRMTLHQPLPSYNMPGNSAHPEQPLRIIQVFKTLEAHGLTSRMKRIAVREAVRQEVMLVHSEEHWLRIRSTCFQPLSYLEKCTEYFERLSLYVNTESFDCARLSCGGVIEMGRAIAEGQIRNGFAIVRPPGHHAEPEAAMGFCFFNNVAVTAKWLRTVYADQMSQTSAGDPVKLDKILILDWDVHHGNGTQRAFWDDGKVMYMSLHRHDGFFYPGGDFGGADQVGVGAGEGYSVNIPFREKGMTDADYLYAFQQVVMPIAHEFAPDFVLVSAGFDAALGDELGLMRVSPAGFAHMTHMLGALAHGRMLVALEGGYNVDAIARSALECVRVLVGEAPRGLGTLPPVSDAAHETVAAVRAAQSRYWRCMGDTALPRATLADAGFTAPLAEILTRFRTASVGAEFGLYSAVLQDARLAAFAGQVLCSPDVYDCRVLVLFLHDLGTLKAAVSGASLDVDVEKTVLLDASRAVLGWARDAGYGIIDANLLTHHPTRRDTPPSDSRAAELLGSYLWDAFIALARARDVILIGSGAGCRAVVSLVASKTYALKARVRACISVLGHETPLELEASSGVRPWYKDNSLVLVPGDHPLLEDARRGGKHQKKYGTVNRPEPGEETRALYMLGASMPKIKAFVQARLTGPDGAAAPDTEGGAGDAMVVDAPDGVSGAENDTAGTWNGHSINGGSNGVNSA